MAVCAIDWKLIWKTWSEWLRRIWGLDQPTFICRIGQKVLGIISPLGTLVLPGPVIKMLFPVPLPWTSSCVTSSPFHPFLFCTFLSRLSLMPWVVFQNTLCRHTGEWLTQVTCYCQPVMYLPEVGGYCISVLPCLKHQGQNNFNPTLEETLEHLKASPKHSPWRLTMALVVPFLYSQ